MAAPKTTVWELEPRTRAKHEILKRYLRAWVPILSQGRFPELLYVDGFAGPGRYSKGEQGSPIIALRTAIDQRVAIQAKLQFLFVEIDEKRANVLEELVDEIDLPKSFSVEIGKGETFETVFTRLLNTYKSKGRSLPPTFAFIDPFGWTGAPFSLVREIMNFSSCEVLVTFMYEEINRFIGHPDQEENFDTFFGTREWRSGINIGKPSERNRFLHDLYLKQLVSDTGAKYVRSFQMRNKSNVTDYYLFYATKNLRGLQKMKEAMWKVDESGEFIFSDATDPNQLIMFEKEPRFDDLKQKILSHFGGREATIEEIEEFILVETAFRETHYKRQILRPMELADPPELKPINPPRGRRIGTYGQKTLRLRFLQPKFGWSKRQQKNGGRSPRFR